MSTIAAAGLPIQFINMRIGRTRDIFKGVYFIMGRVKNNLLKREASQTRPLVVPRSSAIAKTNVLKKKAWTLDEDQKLLALVIKHGPHKWSHIASLMKDRVGKQCRERWHNHLNPRIKKENWNDREEWTLFICHQLMGNKWAEISKHINGRTDNSIKNHWNSSMRKKISGLRLKLQGAIDQLNEFPARFTKKYPPFERNTIKEIIATDAMNKNWDMISEKDDNARPSKKNGSDGGNRQRISLDLFDNVERIDELIDSIDKNLISIPEMAAILEFINQHEDLIMNNKAASGAPNSTQKAKEGFKHMAMAFITPGRDNNPDTNVNKEEKPIPAEFTLYSNENSPKKEDAEPTAPEAKPVNVTTFNLDNFDVSSAIFQPMARTPKETPLKKCILSVLKDHDYASPDADAERRFGARPITDNIRSPF